MRPVLSATAALALLFAAVDVLAVSLLAAEYKPVVVVSMANYETLVKDVNAFVDPRFTALAADLLGKVFATRIDPATMAPLGLDSRRPWGLIVEGDGQSYPACGFFPVTDLGRLFSGPVAKGKLKPPAAGVYQIKAADRLWYVQQKGPWAFFATSRHGLEDVPGDPVKALGGLHQSHDVAIRISAENLPSDVRQVAQRWLKEGHRLVLPPKPGQTDLESALHTALANQGLRLAAMIVDEGDTLLAGASLDFRARTLVVEGEITFRPGTEMAVSLAAPGRTKTGFGGFVLPQAAATGVWTGGIARMPLYQVLMLFETAVGQLVPRGGDQRVADLWSTIRDAMLGETVDGGAAAIVVPNGVTLMAGGFVADGAAIDKKLRVIAEARRRAAANAMTWRLDAARFRDVRMHVLSIPIPKDAVDRGRLVQIFGDPTEVVIGVGDESLYVGAGKNAVQNLRRAMRESPSVGGRKQSPVQFQVTLGPVARLLAETDTSPARTAALRLAESLEQSRRDHVRLTARPVERGMHVRLEIEDGVLRWLATKRD